MSNISFGPVMLGIDGLALSLEERTLLNYSQVGGVILFARNFRDVEQVRALITEIRHVRTQPILIAVDHEGGRVQRFLEGFTHLPAARRYGALYESSPEQARRLAEVAGWLGAAELLAVGIDLSFAPVLDLDLGLSEVIGDRAFHSDPEIASDLANNYMAGMQRAGMQAIGKHFPGHGSVQADSHHALPVDERTFDDIVALDMKPFANLISEGLAGLMTAHIAYPNIDDKVATYSKFWLQEVLRERLSFEGAIISDDLGMAGAHLDSDAEEPMTGRALLALESGCDMVILGNDKPAAIDVLQAVAGYRNEASEQRLAKLQGKFILDYHQLKDSAEWCAAKDLLAPLQ